MNVSKDTVRTIFTQVFIILSSLLLVSFIVGVLGYENPLLPLPKNAMLQEFMPYVSTRDLAMNRWFIVREWPTALFFILVILGEIAIFRLRKKIFLKEERK